jgi:predicted aminopeptidase
MRGGASVVAEPFNDPAVTGLAGVIGTAALAWLGQRLVGKAAIQSAVALTYEKQTATFKELLDQLRQELRVALNERDEARQQASERAAQIEELRRTISALELRIAQAVLPRPPSAPAAG